MPFTILQQNGKLKKIAAFIANQSFTENQSTKPNDSRKIPYTLLICAK
jgi:hypothetical protein